MLSRLPLFLRSLILPRFDSAELEAQYSAWYQDTRGRQIAAIAGLTGLLYGVFAVFDRLVAPAESAPLMFSVHLFIMTPLLLLTSALLFSKKTYKVGSAFLFAAPIIAAAINAIIVVRLEQPEVYHTEIYLILFWIFTVSGMRLFRAMWSALFVELVILFATLKYKPTSDEVLAMHMFWMFAACAFGVVTSYFLEKSNRTIFFTNLQLEKLAITDKLTGLYNRAKLDQILLNELNRSDRFSLELGLLVIDVDFFKKINDQHGHLIGDDILVRLATLLQGRIRKTDTVARWGGEEFLILYSGASGESVKNLAENLREEIEQTSFGVVGRVTVSVGATSYLKGDTIQSIFHRADRALYRAKQNGRNQVVFE